MTKTLRVIQFEALIPNEGGTTLALFKAYQWESGWRIMATLPKQKIYYELKDLAEIDETVAVKYFVVYLLFSPSHLGWVCFVGGILNMIQAFNPFTAGLFVIGLLKFLMADIVTLTLFNLGLALSNWLDKEEVDA